MIQRFYKEVIVSERDGGWRVLLDGRAIRTPAKAPQILPSAPLAELLAQEWRAQGEELDPRSFPRRDLADYAIDVIAADQSKAIAALLAYAETDTLCYRAEPDEPLWRRQRDLWEPLVTACEARHTVKFERISGIVHKPQPATTLEALKARLESLNPFTLAALTTLASLSASLIVALAALEPEADPAALFTAANAEEDWQAELWGWDYEAEDARKARAETFAMVTEFAAAARS